VLVEVEAGAEPAADGRFCFMVSHPGLVGFAATNLGDLGLSPFRLGDEILAVRRFFAGVASSGPGPLFTALNVGSNWVSI